MKLIAGLGNPEDRYAKNRHNAGFMVVDALAKELGVTFKPDKYNVQSDFAVFENVCLLKPGSFMNNSGEPIAKIVSKNNLKTEDVWVIHDDADLEFGVIKVKQGGGNAGHNGLKSIDDKIGDSYWRVRIGIGREQNLPLDAFVLQDFSDEQLQDLSAEIDELVGFLVKSIKTNLESKTFYYAKKD